MRKEFLFICITALLTLIMPSCKTKTVYVPVKQTSVEYVTLRDTVVESRLEYQRDTIVTADTISFLSNRYTYSWAESKNGMLHHSLVVWPDSSFPVRVQYVEKLRIDSIPAPYPVEVPVYITKELSRWEKLRIRLGELGLLGIVVGLFIWRISKRRLP